MKHVLFIKILLMFFIFGSGMNAFNEKYKDKPSLEIINLILHIFIAILLGIGVCWLP